MTLHNKVIASGLLTSFSMFNIFPAPRNDGNDQAVTLITRLPTGTSLRGGSRRSIGSDKARRRRSNLSIGLRFQIMMIAAGRVSFVLKLIAPVRLSPCRFILRGLVREGGG